MSRKAPAAMRAHYLRALVALPIPAQPVKLGPEDLTILGAARIDEYEVVLGTATDAPRLWIAFSGPEPAILGHFTGLVTGEPDLWIADSDHRDWVSQADHLLHLKLAATRVWADCQRACEG